MSEKNRPKTYLQIKLKHSHMCKIETDSANHIFTNNQAYTMEALEPITVATQAPMDKRALKEDRKQKEKDAKADYKAEKARVKAEYRAAKAH